MSDNIYPFPISRSSHWVKHTAAQVLDHHGEAADVYWRKLIKGLRLDMARCGVSKDRAEDELYAFASSIRQEVDGAPHSDRDGGTVA